MLQFIVGVLMTIGAGAAARAMDYQVVGSGLAAYYVFLSAGLFLGGVFLITRSINRL